MMASLENKVDEQVSKVPQQNGGNCRNEELQLEDAPDNNNESIEVEMVVPPDGGWGWMIVAASFMCNLFVDGIIFSFGVFLNDISEAFAVSKARVALVGSLQSGFYLMAGPFVSALANRYGFRLVAILGSVISCSAFVLSYFSTSIEFLYISYGVLGGIGAGLIYVPAVITTGFYFERWRALATGIAVCGSGIGAFMLAPISDILVKQFGWRGALLFQAGMLLNCAIFGAMFRPLKSTRIKVKSSPENAGLEVKSSLMARGVSTASLHCMQPERSGFFGTNNNTDYPTAAELLGSNSNIVNASKSLHSLHKIHAELRTLERKLSSSEKRLSVPIYPELDVNMDEKMVEEENNLLGGDVERLNGKVPTIRRHTISGRRLRADSDCSQKSLKMGNRRNPFSKDPQRPFYRDDIFYGGSLNRLPHYKSQQSSVGYHMSVTRLPTAKDVAEEESGSCYICPESVRRILTTMLDLSLLKSPSFLILAISGGLTMMGFYTPFMYVPDRAQLAGIEASTAMFLVSVIGIGNTIGRVVCGLASSLPGVNALVVNNIFISAAGLFTIFSGLSLSKGYQFFYAAGFGISISVFASLRSILVVDLLGLEKLTNAFGLLLLFQGVAAAVGAPLAGIFMDATGSYDASFYLSGSLIFLSAVICYPLKRINVWETKKNGDKCSDDPS